MAAESPGLRESRRGRKKGTPMRYLQPWLTGFCGGSDCIGGTAVRDVAREDNENPPGNRLRVAAAGKENFEPDPVLLKV